MLIASPTILKLSLILLSAVLKNTLLLLLLLLKGLVYSLFYNAFTIITT